MALFWAWEALSHRLMGLDVASSERELMRTCQHVNKGENKSNAFIMLVTTVISLCSKVNISLTLKNIQMDQFVKFENITSTPACVCLFVWGYRSYLQVMLQIFHQHLYNNI